MKDISDRMVACIFGVIVFVTLAVCGLALSEVERSQGKQKLDLTTVEVTLGDGQQVKIGLIGIDGQKFWVIQASSGRWILAPFDKPPVVEPKEYH